MCKRGDTIEIELPVVGKVDVDRCIAPIIIALNAAGISTEGCCCGHGRQVGFVHLSDGRYLSVYPDRTQFLPYAHNLLKKEEDQNNG